MSRLPEPQLNYHVLITYRNFFARSGPASHVGLGVNALQTAKCLRSHGVLADALGVWAPASIGDALQKDSSITHCILEAPWIPTVEKEKLIQAFPRVEFVERCHSQIGFLQVEAGAIALFRQSALLESANLNFRIAGNSNRFCQFFQQSYNYHCLYLPNLYDVTRPSTWKHHNPGNPLRMGSFGALRLLKNHTTAAAAAMMTARRRNVDLEFYVNVNREEHGKGILASLTNMFAGLSWAKLKQAEWMSWAEFSTFIAHMDLCFQLSFTETFNIVTADAAAVHVPSVVSEAIDWIPRDWVAPEDSPEAAATIADHLLSDPHAGATGRQALQHYVSGAVLRWKQYLNQSAAQANMGIAPLPA